jgi:hypothetical protein
MIPDWIHAIFGVVVAVVLFFALSLLLMPLDRAQRIVRFLKRLLFGGKI